MRQGRLPRLRWQRQGHPQQGHPRSAVPTHSLPSVRSKSSSGISTNDTWAASGGRSAGACGRVITPLQGCMRPSAVPSPPRHALPASGPVAAAGCCAPAGPARPAHLHGAHHRHALEQRAAGEAQAPLEHRVFHAHRKGERILELLRAGRGCRKRGGCSRSARRWARAQAPQCTQASSTRAPVPHPTSRQHPPATRFL